MSKNNQTSKHKAKKDRRKQNRQPKTVSVFIPFDEQGFIDMGDGTIIHRDTMIAAIERFEGVQIKPLSDKESQDFLNFRLRLNKKEDE